VLLHAALERFGRDGRLDVEAAAAGLDGMAGLEGKAAVALKDDAEHTLTRLLSDTAIRELLSPGPGKYFELPLMLMQGRELVYGKADLVVIEGDTALVYDYKTGLSGLSDEEVLRVYSPQLVGYCEAARGAFGLTRAEGFILLVDSGRLVGPTPKRL
jgi:ATP-dependent exoDNAse (exonuclease V) beta subunit